MRNSRYGVAGGGPARLELREGECVHPGTLRPSMRHRTHVPVPLAAALLVVLVAACDYGPADRAAGRAPAVHSDPPPRPGPSPSSRRRAPVRATPRPSRRRRRPAGPRGASASALEPVVGGLDQPLFVTPVGDGTGRLFVVEQGGVIRIVEDGALRGAAVPRHLRPRDAPVASVACSGSRCRPRSGRGATRSIVHYSDAERRHGHLGVPGNRATTCRRPTRTASGRSSPRTSRTPTTTAAGSASTPTGCCSSRLGDGGAGGDPENRASDLWHDPRQAAPDRRPRRDRRAVRDPGRQPVRGTGRRAAGDPALRPAQPVP